MRARLCVMQMFMMLRHLHTDTSAKTLAVRANVRRRLHPLEKQDTLAMPRFFCTHAWLGKQLRCHRQADLHHCLHSVSRRIAQTSFHSSRAWAACSSQAAMTPTAGLRWHPRQANQGTLGCASAAHKCCLLARTHACTPGQAVCSASPQAWALVLLGQAPTAAAPAAAASAARPAPAAQNPSPTTLRAWASCAAWRAPAAAASAPAAAAARPARRHAGLEHVLVLLQVVQQQQPRAGRHPCLLQRPGRALEPC